MALVISHSNLIKGVRLNSVGHSETSHRTCSCRLFQKNFAQDNIKRTEWACVQFIAFPVKKEALWRWHLKWRWMEKQWPQRKVKLIVSFVLIKIIFWGTLLEGTSLKEIIRS